MKHFILILCVLFSFELTAQSRLVQNLDKGIPQCLVVYGTSIESNKNGQMWVGMLEKELNRRYSGQLTLYNSGCSGKNSEWALDNLADSVLARNPNTVIIEFATNDAVTRFDITLEECRDNTEKIINTIIKTLPNCEILLHTPCGHPLGENSAKRPQMNEYNAIYGELALKYKLVLIDETAFLQHIFRTQGEDSLKLYVRDGVHSTGRGATKLFYPSSLRALLYGRAPYILTPAPDNKPRINSPKIFGVRPNSPFLYTVAASGLKPMHYSAKGLPKGLIIDEATGIISGKIKKEGTINVTLYAKNSEGLAESPLKIIVGDRIALTPPMGWNSWNCWGKSVSEEKVLSTARAIIKKGLADYGWTYINIDDGWQGNRNGKQKALMPNEKFSDIKSVIDTVHSLGLKFGLYSTPWVGSYAGFPGSSCDNPNGNYFFNGTDSSRIASHHIGQYSFVKQDIKQWTQWGFDYLKYDWVTNDIQSTKEIHDELIKAGRDIILSISNRAPFEKAAVWRDYTNSFRTTGDIRDCWESVSSIGFNQEQWAEYSGPGHWADPDMLVVGKVGWGPSLRPTRLSPDEQYSHISLWALLSAPMLIGCDIDEIDPFTLNLLCNSEVNDINQDPLGASIDIISKESGKYIYAKQMENGELAIGLFNTNEELVTISISSTILGLKSTSIIRDVWRQKDISTLDLNDIIDFDIVPHGVVLLRLRAR